MRILGTGLWVFWASVACAQTSTYVCSIEMLQSQGGWLAPLVVVNHVAGSEKVGVFDAIIHQENDGKILEGQATKDTKSNFTARWTLMVTHRGQTAKLAYRIQIEKASGHAHFYMKPRGYASDYQGRGRCETGISK